MVLGLGCGEAVESGAEAGGTITAEAVESTCDSLSRRSC